MKNVKILDFQGDWGELESSVCFYRQSCRKLFQKKLRNHAKLDKAKQIW